MVRRKTVDQNPLDSVLPVAATEDYQESSGDGKPRPRKKQSVGVQLSADLMERVRNGLYACRETMTAFAEMAFLEQIKRLEEERNNGKPFAPRAGDLHVGRPLQ